MFQKSKRLISLILVCLMVLGNTDTLFASGTQEQEQGRANGGDWTYTIPDNPEDGITLTRYNGSDAKVVIPGTLDGHPVKAMTSTVFPHIDNTISEITIPKEMTDIQPLTFYHIETLEKFTVEEGNEKYFARDGILYCKEEDTIYYQNVLKLFCCPPAKQMPVVTIPDDVKMVGSYAFYECSGIGNVIIGEHVTRIERQAFYMSSMKNLTLGSGRRDIGTGAFDSCRQLEKVSISGDMTMQNEWSQNPFVSCSALKEISIQGTSSQYVLKDGVLFSKDEKRLLSYPAQKEGDTYQVPDTVEEIAHYAFMVNQNLKQVKLPDNLREIGSAAFAVSKQLKSVTGGKQVRTIVGNAFSKCYELETFEFSDTLEWLGEKAFYQCTSFSAPIVLPSSLQYFGQEVFIDCENVTEITFLATDFQIDNDRSSIDGNVVIKGYKGSSAENYAKQCGKIFVDIDTEERIDYSYDIQKLLELLPENLEFGEPVLRNSIPHEDDISSEEYVGLKNFTDDLVKDCATDYQKMVKITGWVSRHITYTFGAMAGATIDSVYSTFYQEEPQGNCEVYAQMTAYMLYLEDIPCVTMKNDCHQWCCAYSKEDGEWYVIDATGFFIRECSSYNFPDIHRNPQLFFSSNGMALAIRNTAGVELLSINYGRLSNKVKEFTIPDFITYIWDGVFDYYGIPEDFLIHGTKGTYAEQYVKDKGYECIRYQGNTFTACRKHKKKEIYSEETGTYRIVCERCGSELETGKFLNRPEITSLKETDSGVAVTWNKVSHAEKYRIYRKWCQEDGGYFEWYLAGETDADTTEFVDNDSNVRRDGGAWYYTVQAVAEGVVSHEINHTESSDTYVVCKPGNTSFHFAQMEDDGIHLYWSGVSRYYTGIEIYRSTDGGEYGKIFSSEKIIYDWKDTTADTAKFNTYYMRTYNKVGNTIQYGDDSEPITIGDLSSAAIELSPSAFTYNGTPQTPDVTVKVGNVVLNKGTDYNVSVRDNVNAGTASIKVNGKGYISGSVTKNYTIEKAAANLTAKAEKASIDENGRTIIRPSVVWGGECSFQSSDETIATVTDHGIVTGISAGTATITVTSEETENCASGSVSVQITVKPGACVHEYVYTKTDDANCTTPEMGTYTCSKCRDSYTAYNGKKLGHDYIKTVIEPTCTENGYTLYECSRCGVSYKQNYTWPRGHRYDDGEVTKQPTCDTAGEITYKCQFCTNEKISKTAAIGHVYDGGDDIVSPTCQSEGLRKYSCYKCGSSYTKTVARKSHAYSLEYMDADCTTDGYYVRVCQYCGKEQYPREVIKAYGHDFSQSEPVIIKQAGCTEQGEAEQSCVRCGQTQKEIVLAKGHDYQGEIKKPANCTEAGERLDTCSVCNVKKTEIIEPLGHDYETVVKQPTCTEPGSFTYTCKRCQNTYQDNERPATGHEFEFMTIISNAKCETDGTDRYKCKHCGELEDRTKPALGHDYTDEIVERKATCQEEGMAVSTCGNCGNRKIRTIPKQAHAYECSVVQPANGEPGRRKYVCRWCGDYYSETFGTGDTGSQGGPKAPVANTIKASDITKTAKSSSQSFKLNVTQKGNGALYFRSDNPAVLINNSSRIVTITANFVGKVTITIMSVSTNEYLAATKVITLQVNPASVKITKAVSQNRKLVVKWKKNAKASGYEIQYAADKSFKSNLKTVKIKKNKTVSYKSPKLKKGKKYYVRVRTYKNGCYSAWSKTKAVKIKN